MLEKAVFSVTYVVKGTEKTVSSSNSDINISREIKDGVLNVFIRADFPITVKEISLTENYLFSKDTKFFGNGFQSWTDTKEYGRNARMRDLGFKGKHTKMGPIFVNGGDYPFVKYNRLRFGYQHSLSYTYLRNGANYELIGSLNERDGYTVIYADTRKNTIKIVKDLEDVVIEGSYRVFSLFTAEGSYDRVFDAYFGKMGAKLQAKAPLKGYTSWYNYYSNIKEDIILNDLEALTREAPELNTFQIDDGYQTAVGDWLSIDSSKFPNGMDVIADAIHDKGLKAGLWLAPFAAQHNSKLFAEHPDWMIKDKDGAPKIIGPNWGGFYGLNPYHKDARNYIRNVFDTVLNSWGYDLVKLDFLYAAGSAPLQNKSRGQCMFEAMDFIRECVGKKEILGCGVPIIPCVNKVEYMRIGADMGLSWSQGMYAVTTHREDVNTRNAIHNGLNRRHLNGRVFYNDPDVFLLRDYNIKLTLEQRKLLAKLIKLTGGVFFTSDDVNRYNGEQKDYLHYMFSDPALEIQDVSLEKNQYVINYTEDGQSKTLRFSLKNGKVLSGE